MFTIRYIIIVVLINNNISINLLLNFSINFTIAKILKEHGHHGHSHGNGLARNHSRLSELANTDDNDTDFTYEKQVSSNID